jgi:23S rRNA-/tRNA-specific pseudouridylate synthase
MEVIAPILGDPLYTRSSISEKIAKITRLPEKRIFLHAAQLTLSVRPRVIIDVL